jgi:tRNA pseudouridine13 synthase
VPVLAAEPEDFRVEELPLYAPQGSGGHTFVQVEKRLLDTEDVARALARAAGVAPREVGYAGRKDRRAVARQWLSVPALAPEVALALELPGCRVLAAARHPHKLRTGQLAGNRFELVVREVPADAAARAPEALAELSRRGFPNRFGPQRRGRDGRNAERGRALLSGERVGRDRRAGRFLLSALQAEVFDSALAARPLPPYRLETGDVALLHESGGAFVVEDAAVEQPRADAFEISPTGPIFGTRMLLPAGAPGERERALLAAFGVAGELRPPPGIRLRGSRRALRARPDEAWLRVEPGALCLGFRLAPGCYASVFVEELLAAIGAGPLRRPTLDDRGASAGVE